MYSRNYANADGGTEKINVPPEYGGTAIPRQYPNEPPPENIGSEPLFPPPPEAEDNRAPRPECPPPPPIPSQHAHRPRFGGILDKISSEDLLIFGAAALLVFGDADDIFSLGVILLLILL